MSIVRCKMCGNVKAVYFHVPDKSNFTCDYCIKREAVDESCNHPSGEIDIDGQCNCCGKFVNHAEGEQ